MTKYNNETPETPIERRCATVVTSVQNWSCLFYYVVCYNIPVLYCQIDLKPLYIYLYSMICELRAVFVCIMYLRPCSDGHISM